MLSQADLFSPFLSIGELREGTQLEEVNGGVCSQLVKDQLWILINAPDFQEFGEGVVREAFSNCIRWRLRVVEDVVGGGFQLGHNLLASEQHFY